MFDDGRKRPSVVPWSTLVCSHDGIPTVHKPPQTSCVIPHTIRLYLLYRLLVLHLLKPRRLFLLIVGLPFVLAEFDGHDYVEGFLEIYL